jgi:hypothetical protein
MQLSSYNRMQSVPIKIAEAFGGGGAKETASSEQAPTATSPSSMTFGKLPCYRYQFCNA